MEPLRFEVTRHSVIPEYQSVKVFRGTTFIGTIGGGNNQDVITFQSSAINTEQPIVLEPFQSTTHIAFQVRIPLKR